jgi:thiol-disulfide isomerase/thioredoxin
MKNCRLSILFLLAILLFVSCSSSDNEKSGGGENDSLAVNRLAKATSGSFALFDLNGNIRRFEEFKGHYPLVLNFWATWCPPCRVELPDLKRIYEEYQPRGLQMIGLAVSDSPERVRRFAEEYKLGWLMLIANQQVASSFRLGRGIPVTIFIDKDGREVSRLVGAHRYQDFRAEVERII